MMNSSDFNGMDTKIERKKRFPVSSRPRFGSGLHRLVVDGFP